ncbi:anti-sigma factor [Cytobacillus firmus]|uniref:anti-sigma factor n=1 Tax=Bacillaceae TaxID=186817 RepID=UPI0013D1DE4F|nr:MULTISPECIES: anti-sigma factor [Bacillaceae]WHY60014.1 anti-sigma factor [Cytobacillus firmus]
MENKCDNLSLYIINELTNQDKKQFEDHLLKCAKCQQELKSIQETWQMLSYDVEETEVPESLKSQVMDFVFEENKFLKHEEKIEAEPISFKERILSVAKRHFSPISTAVTAILIICLIGFYWNSLQLKDTIKSLENKAADPAQIVTTYSLTGQSLAASATGSAYLLQEGTETSLVIALNNMPITKGDEVYQVWLLKNGNRQSAGTLIPDQNGSGLITYRLPPEYSFEDIGITLEPNPFNTQPQGQKVLGT